METCEGENIIDDEDITIFKIRSDLEEFFEVVSHRDRTLRCKLAGRNSCKLDGVKGSLTFISQRGWYNFERHVMRAHKVSKVKFYKGEKMLTRPMKAPQQKNGSTTGLSSYTEAKLQSLLSKEKHCLLCRDLCPSSVKNELNTEEYFCDQLKRLFPGSGGSTTLSHQLFFIFFLRNVVEFPAEKCQDFLKKWKGRRMPETWFSLCMNCREIILQAASINEQLICLQKELDKLRVLVKSKCQECTEGTSAYLTDIEVEIRRHIFCETLKHPPAENSNAGITIDNAFVGNSCDEWMYSPRTIEFETYSEGRPDDTNLILSKKASKRRRLRRKGKKKTFRIGGKSFPATVVKIEPELTKEIEQPKIENDMELTLDESQAGLQETVLVSTGMEPDEGLDDDYVAPPSELDSDDSDFLPSKSENTKKKNAKKLSKSSKSGGNSKRLARNFNIFQKKDDMDAGGTKRRKRSEVYACQLCPSKYKNSSSLREHLEAHEISSAQSNKYDCQKCGFPCPSEMARNRHVNSKHDFEGGMPCTMCDYLSPNRKQLNQHMLEHKTEAENERIEGKYVCKHCNSLYTSYDMLCRHIRSVHYKEIGVTPYQCEQCLSVFSSVRHLRDHVQQTHRKESKYFCDICGAGMLYLSKLKRHMNGHLKEHSYVCEICGADFHYSETLKQHIKKDHPEMEETGGNSSAVDTRTASSTKHICKHCGIELASTTLLCRHIKTHTELYANKCDLCGKSYATPQSLRRHKEINHTEHEVPCTFCGKKFAHQEYIRNHYKFCKRHPDRKLCNELIGEYVEDGAMFIDDQASEDTKNIIHEPMTSSSLERIQETDDSNTGTDASQISQDQQPAELFQNIPHTAILVPVSQVLIQGATFQPMVSSTWSRSTH